LFHFKPSTDDKTAIVTKTYPSPAVPPGTERDHPVFETIPRGGAGPAVGIRLPVNASRRLAGGLLFSITSFYPLIFFRFYKVISFCLPTFAD